jgi:hypothetical protein
MVVSNELEMMRKDSVMERNPRKELFRAVGVPVEIRTGHLPNIRQKRYRFSQVAHWDRIKWKGCAMDAFHYISVRVGG